MKDPVEKLQSQIALSKAKCKKLDSQIVQTTNEIAGLKEREQIALDKEDVKTLRNCIAKRTELEASCEAMKRLKEKLSVGYTDDDIFSTWEAYANEFNASLAPDLNDLEKKFSDLYQSMIKVMKKQNLATGYKYRLADMILAEGTNFEKQVMLGGRLRLLRHPELIKAFDSYIKRDYGPYINADTFISVCSYEGWLEELV